jgi:hypothetical protein
MTTPNKPRSKAPSGGFSKGPGGTFIGIGGAGGGLAGGAETDVFSATVPHIPVAARFPGDEPAPVRGVAGFLPNAIVRSALESRPDGTSEGSYPAVGSTLKLDDSDMLMSQLVDRRRGGPGVWVAGVALALAAIGGVAFFAVNRASADDAQSATSAQPLTSATAPIGSQVVPTPVPTPTPAPNEAHATAKDASASVDPALRAPVTAPAQPRTAHAAQAQAPAARPQRPPPRPAPTTQPTYNARPPATQEPPPAPPTPPPAAAPTLAPDPFGTPE